MGLCYYPQRAWDDYVNSYPDLESAQKVAVNSYPDLESAQKVAKSKLEPFEFDWYQIVDIRTRLIVEEGQVD